MKYFIPICAVAFLLVNLFSALVFTGYAWFNCGIVSIVILLNAAVAFGVASSSFKDAFKISLCSLFSLFTLGEVVCGILSPECFHDNGYLVAIVIAFVLQLLIVSITHFVSKSNQQL